MKVLLALCLACLVGQARAVRSVRLMPVPKGACKWCTPKPRKPRLPKGGPTKFKQLKFKSL